jgi:hypothetical protein
MLAYLFDILEANEQQLIQMPKLMPFKNIGKSIEWRIHIIIQKQTLVVLYSYFHPFFKVVFTNISQDVLV